MDLWGDAVSTSFSSSFFSDRHRTRKQKNHLELFPPKKDNPKDTEKSQKKKKKESEDAAVAATVATAAVGTSDEEASGPESTPQSPVTPQLTSAQIAARVRQGR